MQCRQFGIIYPPLWDDFKNILSPFEKKKNEKKKKQSDTLFRSHSQLRSNERLLRTLFYAADSISDFGFVKRMRTIQRIFFFSRFASFRFFSSSRIVFYSLVNFKSLFFCAAEHDRLFVA